MCSKKIFGLIVILLTFHISSSQLISISTPCLLLVSLLSSESLIQYTEAVPTSSTDRKRRRQEEREKRRQQREEQRQQFKEQYFGDDYNTYTTNNNDNEDTTTSSFDMSSLPSLFNTQKPRDLIEGFKMSLSNTLRGTFYGLTAFIATPIGGLKYGIIGLLGGILTGSILGITMPLYGVMVGITQFARGIIETPQAIVDGFVNCKVYDDTKRVWLEYRLDDDIDEINKLMKEEQIKSSEIGSSVSGSGSTTASSSSRRRVKSTEYYDLLDIQPDASPSEIRSAYRKKARSIHPDKNPDDPNAEENFRILSAAYQTLSDPTKRHKYDTSGRGVDPESPDGMNSDIMLDPIVFFAILFGSEQVEPYIGELSLATTFDALLKLGNTASGTSSSFESWDDIKTAFGWNEAALKRRKRETEIAIHLRSRISDYVDGYLTLEAFKDGCWEEAIQIAKGGSSYGASFLLAIGPALVVEADSFLGYRSSVLGSWRGPISNIKRNLLFIRRKFAVGRSVLRTISHSLRALYESAEVTPNNNDRSRGSINQQRRSSRHDRGSTDKNNNKKRRSDNRVDIDQELLKDNLSNTIPTILDMAWAINYVDISNTLYGACGKLFYDADVSSWEERLRRAEAVHILGSQFYIVGLEASGGNKTVMTTDNVDDIKAQANAAFMESLKKKSSSNNDEM